MATERLRDRKLALESFSPKDGSTCLEDGERGEKKKAFAQCSAEGALVKDVIRGYQTLQVS